MTQDSVVTKVNVGNQTINIDHNTLNVKVAHMKARRHHKSLDIER